MSKLVVLTDPRSDGTALSDYQKGMFDNVLDFGNKIFDPWDEVEILPASGRISQIVKDAGATDVLLMGSNLADIIKKVSPLKIGHLQGPMLYGILARYKDVNWIASPAMYDYTVGPEASWQAASLLGHLYRHLELLRVGFLGWDDTSEPTHYRIVRNMDDWHELQNLLETKRLVAIDSETTSLQRLGNTVLTLQFGFDGRTGWVLPIAHPETPLSPRDIKIILEWLVWYFESGKTALHVFANAVFDLHQIIDLLKIKWYNHKIWDVQAGGFNLYDENNMLRPIYGADKKGIWSLDRLCIEGGMDHFEHTKLGKADRATLVTKPMEDVSEYAAVDVCLPIRIMRMQRALAAWRNERIVGRPYARYFKTVTEVEGSKIQQFCWMERQGLKVDTKYVLSLRGSDSVFLKEIRDAETEFMALPGVVEANKRLQSQKNIRPGASLFGGTGHNAAPPRLFDPGKREHQALLFFDVLGLEPLEVNKDGLGKVDADFKEEYENIPEVKAFTDFQQAKTLHSTFIVGFYKLLRTEPDNRDGRLHSSYGFLFVKSNRSSASKPNLQNIPEHKSRSKLIKRQFIATEGKLFHYPDFSAHETRLLGIAARDSVMGDSVWDGMKTRLTYQYQESIPKDKRELWEKRLWGADIHVQNYGRLYSVDPLTVTKPQRKRVKGTMFGVTYGMSMKSLGITIEDTTEAAQEIYDLIFKDTFKSSGDWLERTKRIGRKRVLVGNILGGVRHLWGYLHPERRVNGAMDRRGPNSSIQGTASNLGFVGGYQVRKLIWELFGIRGIDLGYQVDNAVHDSIAAEANVVNIPLVGYITIHACTTMLHRWMRDTMEFESSIGFEMDAKIGATLSELHDAVRWDDQVDAIEASLIWGKENLGWTQPIDKIMPVVRSNARIVFDIRRAEIKNQITSGQRVNYDMGITRSNALDLGLQFDYQ